jgi:hypothetical protein
MYTLVAIYNPGPDFTTSMDNTRTLTINRAPSTTTAANQMATYNGASQNVMLNATVTSPGGTVNEGTVTFQLQSGGINVGTAVTSMQVAAGAAGVTYVVPGGTPAGTYTIVATYNVANNYSASSDTNHALTISPALSSTVAVNQTAIYNGANQNVALSATVSSANGSISEGTVTFQLKSGSTNVGLAVTSATVAAGAAGATYVVPGGTAAGVYTLVATYNSATNFATSNDSAHTLTINPAASFTLAASQTATYTGANQNVALSASVVSSNGTINEGTLTFQLKSGATNVGTAVTSATVVSGAAGVTYVLPGTALAGTYTIIATYNPATDFLGSSDSSKTLTVAPPNIVLAPASLPQGITGVAYSQQLSASGSLAPFTFSLIAGSLPPAGVTLSSAGLLSGTTLASGAYPITVKATDSTNGTGLYTGTQAFTLTIENFPTTISSVTAVVSPTNGLEYTFTAYVNSPLAITYLWDFGDGTTPQPGNGISHTYGAIGTYLVTLTVSDGVKTIVQQLTVTINSSASPNPIVFQLTNGKLKFNVQTHKDSMNLSGHIPLPLNFKPTGQVFTLSVGTLTKTFTLNAKGAGGDANDKLKLSSGSAPNAFISTSASLKVSLKNQDIYDSVKALGFQNVTGSMSILFPVTLTYTGQTAVDTPTAKYKTSSTGGSATLVPRK